MSQYFAPNVCTWQPAKLSAIGAPGRVVANYVDLAGPQFTNSLNFI
jgi:hypothetical protein